MQTFTLGLGVWFQRLVARNPLVRSSDRVETIAVLLIVALAVLAIPVTKPERVTHLRTDRTRCRS